jgi:hypothetical protein
VSVVSTEYVRKPWKIDGPVKVGNREFSIKECDVPYKSQGHQLWPCSIVLAEMLIAESLGQSLCDAGCGLGLVGTSVADRCKVTLVDEHSQTSLQALRNLTDNRRQGEVYCSNFDSLHKKYDSIVGSEIIYGSYNLRSLASMISRCWTGKGVALFVNSDESSDGQWKNALAKCYLPYKRNNVQHPLSNGEVIPCVVWRLL